MSEKAEEGVENRAFEDETEKRDDDESEDREEENQESGVKEDGKEDDGKAKNDDGNSKWKRAAKNAVHPSLQNKEPKEDESEISSGNESDSGSERDMSESSDEDEPEISLVGKEMSKKDALKALHDYIDDHCCWGRRPAKKLEVKSVTSSTAFKYQIASYTETRRIVRRHRPYHGGWIDDDGEVSRMWDIAVPKPFYPEDEASNPVEYEVDSTYDTKLNHTEEVWTCHRCRGSGRVRCTRCRGSGRINRTDSEGRQYRANCPRCYGSGRVTCGTCDGSGRLVWYKVVVTTFKTIFDDYIYEKTKMDDDVIHAATGDKIMFSAGRRVGAITHFEPEEVAQNSRRLVGRHRGLNNGRCNLWRMTHKLQSVPVFEVKYELDDDDGIFWIAGNNKTIYSEDYPAQCCCICNVPGCFNNCHKCNNCVLL